MCLYINFDHKRILGFPIPKRAKTDLHVYKELKISKILGRNTYYTPYRKTNVQFFNGVAKMTSKFSFTDHFYEVEKGIHAYVNHYLADLPYFDAIIPKGTLYYLGHQEEIVSKKLIIFKTREDYNFYCNQYGNPKSVNLLNL